MHPAFLDQTHALAQHVASGQIIVLFLTPDPFC